MTHQFFQTEAYLTARFGAVSRQLGFRATTKDEWRLWRAELQATLRHLTGLARMVPAPLAPRTTESVQLDGYTRERVEIDTEPGVTMPFYVLIPDNLKGPGPVVIAAHGHGSGGKVSPAGCVEVPGVEARVRQYNYDYGVQCVRQGYVVFCPDARGFGERRERVHENDQSLFTSSCRQLAHMGLPLGLTVTGMWTWDLMRLLDYIETRPETKGAKIGCIGLSGGGLQTLWLAALDERVDCAVVSGYFYGVRDSLLHLSDNCDCNYVPHLWTQADMGDLGALIAPRSLLIEAGRYDPLNGPRGVDNVLEQYAITQQAYTLLNASDRLEIEIFDGEHVWNGKRTPSWLEQWLPSPNV